MIQLNRHLCLWLAVSILTVMQYRLDVTADGFYRVYLKTYKDVGSNNITDPTFEPLHIDSSKDCVLSMNRDASSWSCALQPEQDESSTATFGIAIVPACDFEQVPGCEGKFVLKYSETNRGPTGTKSMIFVDDQTGYLKRNYRPMGVSSHKETTIELGMKRQTEEPNGAPPMFSVYEGQEVAFFDSNLSFTSPFKLRFSTKRQVAYVPENSICVLEYPKRFQRRWPCLEELELVNDIPTSDGFAIVQDGADAYSLQRYSSRSGYPSGTVAGITLAEGVIIKRKGILNDSWILQAKTKGNNYFKAKVYSEDVHFENNRFLVSFEHRYENTYGATMDYNFALSVPPANGVSQFGTESDSMHNSVSKMTGLALTLLPDDKAVYSGKRLLITRLSDLTDPPSPYLIGIIREIEGSVPYDIKHQVAFSTATWSVQMSVPIIYNSVSKARTEYERLRKILNRDISKIKNEDIKDDAEFLKAKHTKLMEFYRNCSKVDDTFKNDPGTEWSKQHVRYCIEVTELCVQVQNKHDEYVEAYVAPAVGIVDRVKNAAQSGIHFVETEILSRKMIVDDLLLMKKQAKFKLKGTKWNAPLNQFRLKSDVHVIKRGIGKQDSAIANAKTRLRTVQNIVKNESRPVHDRLTAIALQFSSEYGDKK